VNCSCWGEFASELTRLVRGFISIHLRGVGEGPKPSAPNRNVQSYVVTSNAPVLLESDIRHRFRLPMSFAHFVPLGFAGSVHCLVEGACPENGHEPDIGTFIRQSALMDALLLGNCVCPVTARFYRVALFFSSQAETSGQEKRRYLPTLKWGTGFCCRRRVISNTHRRDVFKRSASSSGVSMSDGLMTVCIGLTLIFWCAIRAAGE
jgi:hypothetical protein